MWPLRFRLALASPALLLAALAAPPAFGLAQRTFVASYGNDVNPCSLALPCRAFSFAIAQAFPGGEVVVLDSAGYGPVTITQSVSLIALAGVYAGISVIPPANTIGVTISGSGIKVVLQNISINAVGAADSGIDVLNAAEVDIVGCAISNFVGGGIYAGSTGMKLVVRDTLVRDNVGISAFSGYGITLAAQMRATLERVRVVHNSNDGILLDVSAQVSVKQGVIASNGGAGIHVHASSPGSLSVLTLEGSLIADNGGDGIAAGTISGLGATTEVSASRNTITRNGGYGVSVSGPAPDSNTATLASNLISQNALDGVWASGDTADITADNNTFAGNGASALRAESGGTIHTVKGADGLPNNAGEQTTPTIGNVVPSNPF